MDKDESNQPLYLKYDLVLRKAFDIRLKSGHEMMKAVIEDEAKSKTVHFLKGTRVYSLDIYTKQLTEMDFTKNHEVLFFKTNNNQQFFLCLFRNGKLFAIDSITKSKIVLFKNLILTDITSLLPNETFNSIFNIWANESLTKVIVSSKENIIIWYQSHIKHNQGHRKISEALGYHIYIQLEEERKILINSNTLNNIKDFTEKTSCVFSNNSFYGSFIKIFYVIVHRVINKTDCIKIIIVSYLFFFEKENNFSSSGSEPNDETEYKKRFDSRYLYSYLVNIKEPQSEVPIAKDAIIIKPNKEGNIVAIGLNFLNESNTTLILFMAEIYKFTSFKLCSLFPSKPWKIWVEDIEWLCNGTYIIILFSYGYFTILNLNLQVIVFSDTSNNITQLANTDLIHIPNIFMVPTKLQFNDKIRLMTNKNSTDSFFFYSSNTIIGFHCINKDYHNHQIIKSILTFEDYIHSLKYYQLQINLNTEQMSFFDKIHSFTLLHFNDAFNRETDMVIQSENINQLIKSLIKFVQMFKAFSLQHETSLSLLSYLIGISNDFFYYLIKLKEIWLAFIFIDLSEKYLLKHLRLKTLKSKANDSQIFKGQISYFLFNPFFSSNPSLKCFNKILNYPFYSALRLVLMIYALIQFRNIQALNINVLYFVLAKGILLKLKKHNLIDDIHFLLKLIIRNWKYLKSENIRAGGEEFVLSGLSLNLRSELLSQFIYNKPPRHDIKFDFFAEYFSIDELNSFTSLNQLYCEGDEERLINEYNYINNIGVIQKWNLFFLNHLYTDLFDDFKEYLNTHLKQSVENVNQKKAENISPEEVILSRLTFFNLVFFLLELENYIRQLLELFNKGYCNRNNDNKGKLMYIYNKEIFKFVSPIDVPFLIFEFSSTEYVQQNQTLAYEITINLFNIIERYRKSYSLGINEAAFFIEFINENGFKMYSEKRPTIIASDNGNNREQYYIYTILVFYLFIVHKTNSLFLLRTQERLIFQSIKLLNNTLKKEIYELLLLILNGYLRLYIYKSIDKTLTKNESKCNEMVIGFLTKLYLHYTQAEPYSIRINLAEYISITPPVIKPLFIYIAIQAEYLALKQIAKSTVLNTESIIHKGNLNKNLPIKNIFEVLCENQSLSTSTIFEILFPSIEKDNLKCIFGNLSSLLFNYDRTKESLFSLESDSKKISQILQSNWDFPEKLMNKLIKGPIDTFKDHYDLSQDLLFKLKATIMKIMNYCTIVYIKTKLLSINPNQNILHYLKLLSYSILFENSNATYIKYINIIIHTLKSINLSQMKTDIDQQKITEILQLLNFGFLVQDIEVVDSFVQFEAWLRETNQEYYHNYVNKVQSQLAIVKLRVVPCLSGIKSKMMRRIVLCLNIEGYCKTLMIALNQMSAYAHSVIESNKRIPMQYVREKYVVLGESFSLLTGITIDTRFDFDTSYQLIHNDDLVQMIITDNYKGNKYSDKETGNIITNITQSFLIKETKSACVFKALKLFKARLSIDKDINSMTNSNEIEDEMIINPVKTEVVKLRIAPHSLNTSEQSHNQNFKKKRIKGLIGAIARSSFKQFVNNIFHIYKIKLSGKELEEIKIISVNIAENSYQMALLKEKYLSTREMDLAQKEEYGNGNTWKPFDLIKANKFQMGKSENSVIYKNLLQKKKHKNLNKALRGQIDELTEKLNRYETLAKTLGKEFANNMK